MHHARQLRHCPPPSDIALQGIAHLSRFSPKRCESAVPGQRGSEPCPLVRRCPVGGDTDERRDLVDDRVPERLHPMETLPVDAIDAERDEFIQPGHQHPRPILAEAKYLRRFGVDRVSEPLRIETVPEHIGVLPEQLIEQEVGVGVDRRDRDVAFRLRPAQHVRAQQHHVTGPDWSFPKFAEQDRRDRKSTRLNSSHVAISYAVFCLKKKKPNPRRSDSLPTSHTIKLAVSYSSTRFCP